MIKVFRFFILSSYDCGVLCEGGLMEEHLSSETDLKSCALLAGLELVTIPFPLGCWDYRGAPHTTSLSLRNSLPVLCNSFTETSLC